MNAQIQSFTKEDTKYGLTINEETGEVTDCKCKSFYFSGRKHTCKHGKAFDQELQRAATFILLQCQVRDIEATARINRELAFSA